MEKKKTIKIQYFDVDDTIVKVIDDGKDVRGFVFKTNSPYPPAKALVDGIEISEQEAIKRLSS